jgi:hypothetical protein
MHAARAVELEGAESVRRNSAGGASRIAERFLDFGCGLGYCEDPWIFIPGWRPSGHELSE